MTSDTRKDEGVPVTEAGLDTVVWFARTARLAVDGKYGREMHQRVARIEREAGVKALDDVLRGLRSEDDSTQLRAIIAEVEAMRAAALRAEVGRDG